MTNICGYAGQELWVDLSQGSVEIRPLNQQLMQKYYGGSGYAAHVLYQELSPGLDPMSPDNILMFSTSPLSHKRVPGGGSVMVCFKSPATGGWGEARCGGSFGLDMKRAGFDFVIIRGRSEKPVYLELAHGQARIKDATQLLGRDVYEKTALMEQGLAEQGLSKSSSMCIGLGGEQLVKYAAIMHEDRAAGRGGGGAVMGSKNLLGIVAAGQNEVEIFDDEGFKQAARAAVAVVAKSEARAGLHAYGTVGDLPANDEDGDLPTKNWRSNSFGKGPELFDNFQENNFIKANPCYKGCPVGCGRIIQVADGPYKTPVHEGGEYETIAAFTAFVLNDNVDLAVHCDYLCNKYGLDTISCAANIAFAMDCYEQGLITLADTNGIPFTWGNEEAIVQAIEMIARRQHIGALLAEGVKIAAAKLGAAAEPMAVHVKGLEGPAHDPRSGKMLGITYGTGNRGMCHIHPLEGMAYDRGKMNWGMMAYGVPDPETMHRWDEEGKGIICKTLQDGLSSPDVLSTCKFLMYTGVTVDDWAAMLSALTGWQVAGQDILETCERVINLQRLFNNREGMGRADDMLHQRALSVPEFGPYAEQPQCVIKDFPALLNEYYGARGWDKETGIPSDHKLRQLGLA